MSFGRLSASPYGLRTRQSFTKHSAIGRKKCRPDFFLRENDDSTNNAIRKDGRNNYFVIAAVLVVVAAVLRSAFLTVNLARVQAQEPNLWVVLDLQAFVGSQTRSVEPQRLCLKN